jgi:hypothetical protein
VFPDGPQQKRVVDIVDALRSSKPASYLSFLGEGLPFLDTYRTMCLAPQPDFRRVLEDVRAMQLAA